MQPAAHLARLIGHLTTLGQIADQAYGDVTALDRDTAPDQALWLGGLREAIERIRLDCADAHHAARQVRDELPPLESLQPRLF